LDLFNENNNDDEEIESEKKNKNFNFKENENSDKNLYSSKIIFLVNEKLKNEHFNIVDLNDLSCTCIEYLNNSRPCSHIFCSIKKYFKNLNLIFDYETFSLCSYKF